MAEHTIDMNVVWRVRGERDLRKLQQQLRFFKTQLKEMQAALEEQAEGYAKLGAGMKEAVLKGGVPSIDKLSNAIEITKDQIKEIKRQMADFGKLTSHLRIPAGMLKKTLEESGVAINKEGKLISATTGRAMPYTKAIDKIIQAHSSWGGVMTMDRDAFIALRKQGYEFLGTGAKLATWVRETTHGLHGFKMELLSVMFFGMQLAGVARSLLRPGLELVGATDVWTATLQAVTAPTLAKMMPDFVSFAETLMSLPEPLKDVATKLLIATYFGGQFLFQLAQTALFMGAVEGNAWKYIVPLSKIALLLTAAYIVTEFWNKRLTDLSNTLSGLEEKIPFLKDIRDTLAKAFEPAKWAPKPLSHALGIITGIGPFAADVLRTIFFRKEQDTSATKKQATEMEKQEKQLQAVNDILNSTNQTMSSHIDITKLAAQYNSTLQQATNLVNSAEQELSKTLVGEIENISSLNDVTSGQQSLLSTIQPEIVGYTNKTSNATDKVSSLNDVVGYVIDSLNTQNQAFNITSDTINRHVIPDNIDLSGQIKKTAEAFDQATTSVQNYTKALRDIPPYVHTTVHQEIKVTTVVSRIVKTIYEAGKTIAGFLTGKTEKEIEKRKTQFGGIFTRPSVRLIAEAGPEAVIPLKKLESYGGKTINISLSPTYNITGVSSKEEIEDMIDEANARLIEDLKSMLR